MLGSCEINKCALVIIKLHFKALHSVRENIICKFQLNVLEAKHLLEIH